MTLLTLDSLDNVLFYTDTPPRQGRTNRYLPFGARYCAGRTTVALHGQLSERPFDGYLPGNGHRLYLPQLGRFAQADQLSPFGAGGVNAYSFCEGDPINRQDLNGRFSLLKVFRLKPKFEGLRFGVSFKQPVEIFDATKGRTVHLKHAKKADQLFKKQTKKTRRAYESLLMARDRELVELASRFEKHSDELIALSRRLEVTESYFGWRMRREKLGNSMNWPGGNSKSVPVQPNRVGSNDPDSGNRDYVIISRPVRR